METKQVIVVRKDLKMRKGKIAAQAAHASMKVVLKEMEREGRNWKLNLKEGSPLEKWLTGPFTKVVVSVDSEEELLAVVAKAKEENVLHALITDSGRTEFQGVPTKTCAAIGPDWAENVNKVTGELRLM